MNYNFYEHNKVLINDLKKCINRTNVTIKEEEVGYYESYITFENSGWCDIFLENFNRALYLNNKINKIIIDNTGDGRPVIRFVYNNGFKDENCGEYPLMLIKTINLQEGWAIPLYFFFRFFSSPPRSWKFPRPILRAFQLVGWVQRQVGTTVLGTTV